MELENPIMEVLKEAKALGKRYYALTGKPLGITGEIAEYEAARLLNLQLAPARQSGFDAIESGHRRLQIKGRCIPKGSKPGQRMGAIDIDKTWDAVLLVILDESFEPIEIYEAERAALIAAILEPGSKSRNERHALGVNKFKAIGKRRWPDGNA